MTAAVGLSVVMAAWNGDRWIDQQLAALAGQRPGPAWEVVVADNGSTDATVARARGWADRLDLRVVDASGRAGQAHARNVGAASARGALLVFVDQDDVVADGYLAAMVGALDRGPGVVAATLDHELLNPAWAIDARRSSVVPGLRDGLYPWSYGCALGIRRDLFERVGGFDEELVCAEDTDLCWRLARDAGVAVEPVPDALLHYRLRASRGELFRQGVLYGRGGPALYRRWAGAGMGRRRPTAVVRGWAGIARGLATGDAARRGRSWYLLGNRIGCALGSLHERVLYL